LATEDDNVFLVWDEANGRHNKSYDIYFKIFRRDLVIGKVKTYININHIEEEQMRPRLSKIGKNKISILYQSNKSISTDERGYATWGKIVDKCGKDIKYSTLYNVYKDGNEIYPNLVELDKNIIYFSFLTDISYKTNQKQFDLRLNKINIEENIIIPQTETALLLKISGNKERNIARDCGVETACKTVSSPLWKTGEFSHIASYANDGIIEYDYYKCFFTDQSVNSYLSIIFNESRFVKRIKIYTRTDNSILRLKNFFVNISNKLSHDESQSCYKNLFPSFEKGGIGTDKFIEFACEGKGQILTINLLNEFLQICEIEVFSEENQSVFYNVYRANNQEITIGYKPLSNSEVNKNEMQLYSYNVKDKEMKLIKTLDFTKLLNRGFVPLVIINNENEDTDNPINWGFIDKHINEAQLKYDCDVSCNNDCIRGSFRCLSCKVGYTKSEDFKCLDNLSRSGYYFEYTNNIYKFCPMNCLKCSSEKCEECEDGYKLSIDFKTCVLNDFTKSVKNNLSNCDISCETCYEDSIDCIFCKSDNYKLEITNFNFIIIEGAENTNQLDHKCYLNKKGYYKPKEENILRKCPDSCEECLDEQFCTKCQTNYYPIEDNRYLEIVESELQEKTLLTEGFKCGIKSYSQGFYFNETSKILKKCDLSCETCKNESTCEVCKDKKYFIEENIPQLLPPLEKLCHEESGNYILDINILRKCDESCDGCQFRRKNCTKCEDDYYNLEVPLVTDMNLCFKDYFGYYLDKTIPLLPLLRKCDISCITCTSKMDCNLCQNEYYRIEDPKEGQEKFCHFAKNSTDKYFLNKDLNKLMLCDKLCKKCMHNKYNCENCNEGSYKIKDKLSDDKNQCFNPLEFLDHFFNQEVKMLEKCDSSCEGCEKNKKNCLKCKENFYKIENNNSTNSAESININECFNNTIIENGYFLNEKKLYSKCDDSCQKCEKSARNCLQCNIQKFYYKFHYKKLSPFIINLNAMKINNMTFDEFSKINLLCAKNNEKLSGIFLDKEKKEFDLCIKGCKICDNSQECKECDFENGFYYFKLLNHKEGECKNIYLLI
jgi:hypothetical protein